MSAEYSVEEVRSVVSDMQATELSVIRAAKGKAAQMLTAYANRIEADERAVPVAWRYRLVAPNGNRGEWFVTQDEPSFERSVSIERQPLFTHPPAQAAQVDRARETPRRQQAVEMLLELGWTYNSERGWEEPATTAEPVAQADTDSSAAIGPLAYSYRDCLKEANRPIASLSTQPHSPDAADSGRVTDAQLLEIFSDEIGFEPDDIQQVNAEDLLRIARAALAAQGQGELIPADAWRDAAADVLGESSNLYRMLCQQAREYASSAPPASPAGVPDARTEMDYEYDAEGLLDPYDSGHMAGWNDCRKVMLAAPSATPEGGEVQP